MSDDGTTGQVPSSPAGRAGPDVAEELRRMWERLDPVPVGLADRVAFALEVDQLTAADVDLELLRLTDQHVGAGAGARGGDDHVRTVTFSGAGTTVVLAIDRTADGHRVDGWVAPGGRRAVEVRTSAGTSREHSDPTGRFTLARVPAGHLQLVLSQIGVDERPVLLTPALTL